MQRVYAQSDLFSTTPNIDGSACISEVSSESNPDKKYRVDLTHGRCDCPAWKFQRGGRVPCKHLRALGYVAPAIEVDMVANNEVKPSVEAVHMSGYDEYL